MRQSKRGASRADKPCLREQLTPDQLAREASDILKYLHANEDNIIATGRGESPGSGVLWRLFKDTLPNQEVSERDVSVTNLRQVIFPLKTYALELVIDACTAHDTSAIVPSFFTFARHAMSLHREFDLLVDFEGPHIEAGLRPGGFMDCLDALSVCYVVLRGPQDLKGCEELRAEFWEQTDPFITNWEQTEIAALDSARLGIRYSTWNEEPRPVCSPGYYDVLNRKTVLSTREACDYLKLSKSTLYKYKRDRKIQTGERGRWTRADLDAFLKQEKVRESPTESERVR